MNEIRCCKCRRFLGKEQIKGGEIQLLCPSCKTWNVVKVISKEVMDAL
jgi:phage FluMu protein Com